MDCCFPEPTQGSACDSRRPATVYFCSILSRIFCEGLLVVFPPSCQHGSFVTSLDIGNKCRRMISEMDPTGVTTRYNIRAFILFRSGVLPSQIPEWEFYSRTSQWWSNTRIQEQRTHKTASVYAGHRVRNCICIHTVKFVTSVECSIIKMEWLLASYVQQNAQINVLNTCTCSILHVLSVWALHTICISCRSLIKSYLDIRCDVTVCDVSCLYVFTSFVSACANHIMREMSS